MSYYVHFSGYTTKEMMIMKMNHKWNWEILNLGRSFDIQPPFWSNEDLEFEHPHLWGICSRAACAVLDEVPSRCHLSSWPVGRECVRWDWVWGGLYWVVLKGLGIFPCLARTTRSLTAQYRCQEKASEQGRAIWSVVPKYPMVWGSLSDGNPNEFEHVKRSPFIPDRLQFFPRASGSFQIELSQHQDGDFDEN